MGEEGLGNVLVLEDDEGIVRLIQLRLQRLGYHVTTATTPTLALSKLEEGKVDLVVLDYRLGGDVGGLDFHRQLQAAGHDIPAILITGFSDEAKVIEAIRAGVRDFVPKTPDFLDDLGPAVARVMEQVRVHRQAADSEAVRRNNRQLQRLIEERQRLEDELRASNAQLIEADRRKNEFLAMLAHELRNPLAAISSAIQLLLKAGEAERAWGQEVIDRQSRHLGRLIDDLLDVSRITQGKIALRKERLDLEYAIKGAVDTVWPMFAERSQSLIIDPVDRPVTLLADPTRIEQILVNLLSNAAKYTDNGGRIKLTTEVIDNDVLISVKDTGVGIPPEMIPRVFELFSQVDQTLARSRGGLGIGLTLVRQLTELHDGKVSVVSDGPGQGSTFTLQLPLLEPENAPAAEASDAGDRPEPHGRKVLIVDDNADTARAMSRFLRLCDFDVATVGDGHAALEVLKTFHPSAILLDIGLPGMDGYEVAAAIRNDPALASATLISISGYSPDAGNSRDRAFDHHLVKPVDFDTLMRLLGTL